MSLIQAQENSGMTIADITSYLISLERSGFSGDLTLVFNDGKVSKRAWKKSFEYIETQEPDCSLKAEKR